MTRADAQGKRGFSGIVVSCLWFVVALTASAETNEWRDAFLDRYIQNGGHVTLAFRQGRNGTVADGPFRVTDSNGVTQLEGRYANERLDGEMLGYHTNGKLAFRLLFQDGKRQGTQVEWDSQGAVSRLIPYHDDEKDGIELYWHDGTISERILWSHGQAQWLERFERGTLAKRFEGLELVQYLRDNVRDTAADGIKNSGTVLNDDPEIRIDLEDTLRHLERACRENRVSKIELLHISKHAVFRTNVSSELFKQSYEFKVTIPDPGRSRYLSDFQKLLKKVDASPLDHPVDLRWGCIFTVEDREKPFEIFSDRSGKVGVINGALVTFKNGNVARWVEKAFGKVLE